MDAAFAAFNAETWRREIEAHRVKREREEAALRARILPSIQHLIDDAKKAFLEAPKTEIVVGLPLISVKAVSYTHLTLPTIA